MISPTEEHQVGSINLAIIHNGQNVSERVCVCVRAQPLRMFVVVEMIDTVRIPPWNFHRQLNDAIAEELNKKLANKASPAHSH